MYNFFFLANKKDESSVDSLKKSECSKPLLWKDYSLFTIPEDPQKNESVIKPSTEITATPAVLAKRTSDIGPNETTIKKLPQSLSTKESNSVGIVTPCLETTPGRTEDEEQTLVSGINEDVKVDCENEKPNQVMTFTVSFIPLSTWQICLCEAK